MLCYAMLCYAMLCYAMLCYAMLCYAMLCYAMLCYAMVRCVMPCYAMLCCAMLCHVMPCNAMPCHAMPCHAMPCHAMPCHATSCTSCVMSCHACEVMFWFIHPTCILIRPGEVELAGKDSGFAVGDRVYGCSFFGGYASRSSEAQHGDTYTRPGRILEAACPL